MSEKEEAGDIHLVVEVSDDGTPALTTYKRIILRMNEPEIE